MPWTFYDKFGQKRATSNAILLPTTLRKNSATVVNTTVAATDLLAGAITLPVLAATSVVRLTAEGDLLHNSGGTDSIPRFQLVLGGTTLLDTGASGTFVSNATRWGWKVDAFIVNLGSVSSQGVQLRVSMEAQNGPSVAVFNTYTVGAGSVECVGGSQLVRGEGRNTTAVNTGVTTTLVLNVINATSSATYETRLLSALVEIV